jgi:hypothetical protein
VAKKILELRHSGSEVTNYTLLKSHFWKVLPLAIFLYATNNGYLLVPFDTDKLEITAPKSCAIDVQTGIWEERPIFSSETGNLIM